MDYISRHPNKKILPEILLAHDFFYLLICYKFLIIGKERMLK
jgi:hypothetical protein